MCMQKRATKIIPTEEDVVAANKLAFNDDIGTVTNHVTSMIEVQAGFDPGTPEYETLAYRIMCGQNFQQNTIDRAKGIIAKPMPEYWYSMRDNMPKENDTDEELKEKEFNRKIAASNKPYFMTYVYPELRAKNNAYIKNNNYGAIMRFSAYGINGVEDLRSYEPKTKEMIDYLEYYDKFIPVGNNPCVVNRICWIFEDTFKNVHFRKASDGFDISILKSNVEYSKKSFNEIYKVYQDYQKHLDSYMQHVRLYGLDSDGYSLERNKFINDFKRRSDEICTNEDELCDIVIDICYKSEKSKQFAWDVCGDVILKNLLKQNGNKIHFPEHVDEDGEFEYCGEQFVMREKVVDYEKYDCFE